MDKAINRSIKVEFSAQTFCVLEEQKKRTFINKMYYLETLLSRANELSSNYKFSHGKPLSPINADTAIEGGSTKPFDRAYFTNLVQPTQYS